MQQPQARDDQQGQAALLRGEEQEGSSQGQPEPVQAVETDHQRMQKSNHALDAIPQKSLWLPKAQPLCPKAVCVAVAVIRRDTPKNGVHVNPCLSSWVVSLLSAVAG